jgi:hypothetical protein
MSVEVQWTDQDPETGEKRFVRVERFATRWQFWVRFRRREDWVVTQNITRAMWEELLDALERRYTRREGVSEADLASVKKILMLLRDKPRFDGEELPGRQSEDHNQDSE